MWQTIIVRPLGWLLLVLYNFTANYGLALIIFTVLIKLVLLPFSMKGKKGMLAMQRFNPKLKELEAKYKNDKEKYNIEMQKLYKKEKVNPLSGCLWQLLPWPIFIALYSVVRTPLENMMNLTSEQIVRIANVPVITEFLSRHGIDISSGASRVIIDNQIKIADGLHQFFDQVQQALPDMASSLVNIDFNFLGLNLSETPSFSVVNAYWFLPILSGGLVWLTTFISQKISGPQAATDQQNSTMKVMTYIGPAMSIYIGYMWPAALSFYWIVSTAIGIVTDTLLTFHYNKAYTAIDDEAAAKAAKEEEYEAKRQEALERRREEGLQAPKKNNMSNRKYKQLKALQQQNSNQKGAQPSAGNADDGQDVSEPSDEPENPEGADA